MSNSAEENLRNVIAFFLVDQDLGDEEKTYLATLRQRLGHPPAAPCGRFGRA